jgi:hypothetical protein
MDHSQLHELVQHPTETLGVEIKRWLNPTDDVESAVVARALIALRNFDGGILILGLDNERSEPCPDPPNNVRELYHADKIQALVGKFARPPFEVEVHFIERDSSELPVFVVPGGVRAPVMARCTVRDPSGKPVLEQNAIYVRCLANNTVSSAKPVTPRDWEELFAKCFAHREADVGQFIQRHIPVLLRTFPNLVPSANETGTEDTITNSATHQKEAFEFLDLGRERYEKRVAELQAANRLRQLPPHGAWEVAFTITGCQLTFSATNEFLNRLFVNQPHYTGWPCWVDSRRLGNELAHPYPYEKGWEALIVRLDQATFYNHIDFWRIEPRGRFYQRRALEDDISAERGNQPLPPLKLLDFLLVIGRAAEAIAVGVQFVKGLGCDPTKTVLNFAFRWTKLQGRELACWAEPLRTLFPGSTAVQNEVKSRVRVPLDTEPAKIFTYVREATRPVFEVFGKEFTDPVYEEISAKTLQRSG